MNSATQKFLNSNLTPAKTFRECLTRGDGDLDLTQLYLVECLAHAVQLLIHDIPDEKEQKKLIDFFKRVAKGGIESEQIQKS